jgi:hypothetical protein
MVDIRTDNDLLVAKINGKIENFFIQAIELTDKIDKHIHRKMDGFKNEQV